MIRKSMPSGYNPMGV
jgi:hypothetical protein